MFISKIGNNPVLNGGIGGGIINASELLQSVKKDDKLKSIIIALGVDDANKNELMPQAIWEKKLIELIKVSNTLVGHKNVYILKIIPVE